MNLSPDYHPIWFGCFLLAAAIGALLLLLLPGQLFYRV
jgi:hypothetical protein